ncbi:MAG TPA: DUF1049 domain-containing protein [Clostridiales bacterium]|nr:DUF1049 domain-containing protein [Clostridiales bacterium]
MQFGFILALIISLLIAIFAIQNGSVVTIDLFFASFQVSQAIVIIISTVVGAIVAAILGSIRQFKHFSITKELKNKIKLIESENVDMHKSVSSYENEIQILTDERNEMKLELTKLKEEYDKKCKETEESIINKTEINDTDYAYLEENNEKGQAES